MLSNCGTVPVSNESSYLNVMTTGIENVVASGPKRYALPTCIGKVLLMDCIEIIVFADNAPAGMLIVNLPSAEEILPPSVPISLFISAPTATPFALTVPFSCVVSVMFCFVHDKKNMTVIAENKIEKSFMFVSCVVNIFMNPASVFQLSFVARPAERRSDGRRTLVQL